MAGFLFMSGVSQAMAAMTLPPMPEAATATAAQWKVLDASGWLYLLPPLLGRRLACVDPTGLVAELLRNAGAKVLCLSTLDAEVPADETFDGLVVHDPAGLILGLAGAKAQGAHLARLIRQVGSGGFVYLAARNRLSPWVMGRRIVKGATESSGGLWPWQLNALVASRKLTAQRRHALLLWGSDLAEVICEHGYRASKNAELASERLRQGLLTPALAPWLAQGQARLWFVDRPSASCTDKVGEHISTAFGETLVLRQYLCLPAGKVVLAFSGADERGGAIVVLAREGRSARRREHEADMLRELAEHPKLPADLKALLPRPLPDMGLAREQLSGAKAYGLSRCDGVSCDLDVQALPALTGLAADFIRTLHRHSLVPQVRQQAATLLAGSWQGAVRRYPWMAHTLDQALGRIQSDAAVQGVLASLPCCVMHGDFKVENVMYDPAGPTLTGVIDWELAQLDGLPLLDLLYLLCFNRGIRGHGDYESLADICALDRLDASEAALLTAYGQVIDLQPAQRRLLVLLFFVHHIGLRVAIVPADDAEAERYAALCTRLVDQCIAAACQRGAPNV